MGKFIEACKMVDALKVRQQDRNMVFNKDTEHYEAKGMLPTPRQRSKFRNKKGIAYKTLHGIPF